METGSWVCGRITGLTKMLARAMRRAHHSGARAASRAVSVPQWQRPAASQRSFLTSRTVTSYVMKRAKIMQIVWRALAAYPQMHYITDPDAPISQLFARDSSNRERAFMFVLSLLPPDEAIDLPEFLGGAEDAAKLVLASVYEADASRLAALETLATPECAVLWKQKREQICRLLHLDEEVNLRLESVEVKHVGVSEVKYTFGDAQLSTNEGEDERTSKDDNLEPPTVGKAVENRAEVEEETDTYSKFLTHEAMQLKVQFDVRELLTVEQADTTRSVAVDSTFEWTFDSDVSRAELLDWVVASASPFSSKVSKTDDSEDDIASAMENVHD